MAEQFIVKDSGQRQEFATGMRRDVQHDKPRYDLVYRGPLLERWAWLLKRGADKYGPDNWTKAATQEELDRFIASAARHFAQWMAGDTGEDHAAAPDAVELGDLAGERIDGLGVAQPGCGSGRSRPAARSCRGGRRSRAGRS